MKKMVNQGIKDRIYIDAHTIKRLKHDKFRTLLEIFCIVIIYSAWKMKCEENNKIHVLSNLRFIETKFKCLF